MTRNLAVRVATAVCLALFAATTLAAQEQTQPAQQNAIVAAVKALQEKVKADLGKAAQSLMDLKAEVEQAAAVDATLSDLKVEVGDLASDISTAMTTLEHRYNLVSKRLDELGNAPETGQPAEDSGVTNDRRRLQGEKAQMNTILTDAEQLQVDASKLSLHITDLRRKLFTETLLRRTEVTPELLDETARAAQGESQELVEKTRSSLDFMWNFKRNGLFGALALALVAAFIFMRLVRWAFAPFIRREEVDDHPAYITRLSRAFWETLIPNIATAAFVLTSIFLLDYFRVLREDIEQIFQAVLWVLAGIYFIYKLTRSIVVPGKPGWRLIPVSDRGARILIIFALLMALVNGLGYLIGEVTEVLDSPIVLSVAKGFITAVTIGFLLIGLAFAKIMRSAIGGPDQPWPRAVRVILSSTGLALILTALFGYIGLAQFASTQIVITGAILITMYIGFLTGHAISRREMFGSTSLGRYLKERLDIDDIRLDQIGLVIGLAIYALVIAYGFPIIMLQWGFRGDDIWAISVKLFTDIHIGNITISLVGILVGMLLFAAGYFATRWFQQWLDRNVLARSHADVGVRNSVNTALGYAGVALAGLIGISAAGISLSSLALVAGALSLGIGFGLQTIVQNFVSGLILLAERPFKVGDWIVAGTTEGFVRRIAVRATEIETFQNQSIIVPNSQLINAAVGNWTLRNSLARSEVAVSVGYDSDPRKVMDILMDIAQSHPLVLTVPEPSVGFMRFGESALEFELRFYLADIFSGGPVRNDVRISILERFRAEGIVMPFPKRDVSLHVEAAGDGSATDDMSPEISAKLKSQRDRRRKTAEAKARDLDAVDDVYDEDGDNTPDNGDAEVEVGGQR